MSVRNENKMFNGIQPMKTAPKDGTRVLVKYYLIVARGFGNWVRSGEKWEECRWVSNKENTGSEPHWEPWCGSEN